MCLQEVRLLGPGDPTAPVTPLDDPDNIAPLACVSVTSTHPDYSVAGLTDGIVDGAPADRSREWCAHGERETAVVRLTWSREETIERVWLFDRPNPSDQIKSGSLLLSDGTAIPTGELPDDTRHGLEIRFPPHEVKWLVFAVNEVKSSSTNIGLAEIGVFRCP